MKPRVALVAHDIKTPGGMEQTYTEVIKRAVDAVDFVVISRTLSPELRQQVEWRPVTVVPRPIPVKFLQFFLAAGLEVSRARADLVHSVGAIVPNRCDLASVQFCHAAFREYAGTLGIPGQSIARRVNRAIGSTLALAAERWCYRPGRTRTLAPVSLGLARELQRHYPGVPVTITPNGVDTRRFAPSAAARQALRHEEGIADPEVVALFVGGDWHRKGLALAIRGLALAQADFRGRLRLWVVGRGDEKRFRSLAQAEGVADRVRFFGSRNDVERFLQTADIFVFPTLYEGFPLVALEAAACGLPLITTRVNGMEELIGTGEGGVLVERTAEQVGKALAQLAAAPGVRQQQGLTARRRVLEYSWARTVAGLLELYRTLLPVAGHAAVEAAPR